MSSARGVSAYLNFLEDGLGISRPRLGLVGASIDVHEFMYKPESVLTSVTLVNDTQ